VNNSETGASPLVPVSITPKEGATEEHNTAGIMMGESGWML